MNFHCFFCFLLQAANALVRANAGRLLSDAFPMEELRSTQSKVIDDDKFMQQQFEAFYNMLLDECPKIRAMGRYKSCRAVTECGKAKIICMLH